MPAFSGILFAVGSTAVILLGKIVWTSIAILASVKAGVERIEILAVQLILSDAQRFAETLEVYHLACPQEFNRRAYIRILD